jgi:hypothetical protein
MSALLAVEQVRQRYRHLYPVPPPPRPSPLDWAHANAVLRTADGRVLRYADSARAYQDAILADPSDRIIIAKSRQIGISQTVAYLAAEEAVAGGTVLWLSRNGEQAGMALDYVYTALSDCAHPAYTKQNSFSLELANGGRVITQPATRGAGRGIPATLVIIDEQAWQEYAREIYTAVVPTLSTTGGRLVVLSTPNGRGNLFHELWEAAQEEGSAWSPHFLPWWHHPDWGDDWAAARRDDIGLEAFAQEYDVDFARSGSAVFEPAHIDRLWRLPAFRDPVAGHRYVSAWDIARKQDAFVGFTIDIATSPFQVVAYERHLRLPYPDQARAIEARHARYPGRTVVESNGVGDPLIQFLGVRVEEFQTTALTKRNAIDALQLLVQRGELVSPLIPQWKRELTLYQRDDKALMQDTVMASAIAALTAGRPPVAIGAY